MASFESIFGTRVHYVAYNGHCLAAIIIGETDPQQGQQVGDEKRLDLAVFTSLFNVNGVKNFGLQFHADVAHNTSYLPGTWHYLSEGEHVE